MKTIEKLFSVKKLFNDSEAYLKPSRTSRMEHLVKKVNRFQPLTMFAKSSILDMHWVLNTTLMIKGHNHVNKIHISSEKSIWNSTDTNF